MQLSSTLDDIFTEPDKSIFSDGSIDPLGFLVVWTALGNKIFKNKLNTVSTNIRYYTLNLFHHYLIKKLVDENPDNFSRLIRREPYFNKADLYEGLAIFLENILIHVANSLSRGETIIVPGIYKFKNLNSVPNKKKNITKLIVSRDEGEILSRQIILGIHGRHKGPFQQMGIFSLNNEEPYHNEQAWIDAEKIFKSSPWKQLYDHLYSLIKNKIFESPLKNKAIELVSQEIVNNELIDLYRPILDLKTYRSVEVRNFWLEKLGFKDGLSGKLYEALALSSDPDYESILKIIQKKTQDPILTAVCAIEPLLTIFEKCFYFLCSPGIYKIDEEVSLFINNWLKRATVDATKIKGFLTKEYFTAEAIKRLEKLVHIYEESKENDEPVTVFVTRLIQFHKELFDSRNNLAWVVIGDKKRISVHRPFPKNNELASDKWIYNYYLNSVESLHKGMFNETV